jgi:hypothetical protein
VIGEQKVALMAEILLRFCISSDFEGTFLQSITDAVKARHIILAGGTP